MTAAARQTIQPIRPQEIGPPSAASVGLVLGGKYRLEAPIARGAMGRVWRAVHTTLHRPVAIKFVESVGWTGDQLTERFLREAQVAASVRHKNVVDILDFGVAATPNGDEPYMVMELLEGQGLDDRLRQGPLSVGETVRITRQVLNGLDAVHGAGIVHRDLKPANVFLSEDQDGLFAHLLDFGISLDATGQSSISGVVIGTPEYMSPEQAFGDPLDQSSDLYSVGVMLYEMLSGMVPFEDDDPKVVVDLVAHEVAPSLQTLRPDLPDLCAVVDRAMSRTAGERFDDARSMRRALLAAAPVASERTDNVPTTPQVGQSTRALSDSRDRATVDANAIAPSERAAEPAVETATQQATLLSSASPETAGQAGPARRAHRVWLLGTAALATVVAIAALTGALSRSQTPAPDERAATLARERTPSTEPRQTAIEELPEPAAVAAPPPTAPDPAAGSAADPRPVTASGVDSARVEPARPLPTRPVARPQAPAEPPPQPVPAQLLPAPPVPAQLAEPARAQPPTDRPRVVPQGRFGPSIMTDFEGVE